VSQLIVESSFKQAVLAAVLTCLPPEQLTSNVTPWGGGSAQACVQIDVHCVCDEPPRKSAPR